MPRLSQLEPFNFNLNFKFKFKLLVITQPEPEAQAASGIMAPSRMSLNFKLNPGLAFASVCVCGFQCQ